MTEYPDSGDYVEALQYPEQAFRDPQLQQAEIALHPRWHTPLAVSGSAAVVFRARVCGRDKALRFFVQDDVSEKDHYTALDRHFVAHHMQDWVSRTSWVDDAVAVNGRRWPMVLMDWIEGDRLDDHVTALVRGGDSSPALQALAADWRARVHQVQTAGFAHGDLQHGNVLVEPSGGLRLVDFDGSWIEELDGSPSHEEGHPNYQHTGRKWGRWMDTFPALVIYTGLLALSHRPDAWRRDEAILFTRRDFIEPDATPTWRLVTAIDDPTVKLAVRRLQSACHPDWCPEGDLEDFLGREPRIAVRPYGGPARDFEIPPELDPDREWWKEPPTTAPPETEFRGIPDAPPSFGKPSPPPPVSPAAAAAAAAIALILAVLLGVIVGKNGGPGAAVGVITAIVLFAGAIPLLRRRL